MQQKKLNNRIIDDSDNDNENNKIIDDSNKIIDNEIIDDSDKIIDDSDKKLFMIVIMIMIFITSQ